MSNYCLFVYSFIYSTALTISRPTLTCDTHSATYTSALLLQSSFMWDFTCNEVFLNCSIDTFK